MTIYWSGRMIPTPGLQSFSLFWAHFMVSMLHFCLSVTGGLKSATWWVSPCCPFSLWVLSLQNALAGRQELSCHSDIWEHHRKQSYWGEISKCWWRPLSQEKQLLHQEWNQNHSCWSRCGSFWRRCCQSEPSLLNSLLQPKRKVLKNLEKVDDSNRNKSELLVSQKVQRGTPLGVSTDCPSQSDQSRLSRDFWQMGLRAPEKRVELYRHGIRHELLLQVQGVGPMEAECGGGIFWEQLIWPPAMLHRWEPRSLWQEKGKAPWCSLLHLGYDWGQKAQAQKAQASRLPGSWGKASGSTPLGNPSYLMPLWKGPAQAAPCMTLFPQSAIPNLPPTPPWGSHWGFSLLY